MGSQPSSGGQSPLAAGTPRGSGITNTGGCRLDVVCKAPESHGIQCLFCVLIAAFEFGFWC